MLLHASLPWNAASSLFSLLLFFSLLFSAHAGTIYGMYKANRCYSCMSEWYEQLFRFGGLDKWFFEPKNFTRGCDEPARPELLETVACRTICLTVQQELTIIGHRTGQLLTMRGCAVSLARRGINNHTLALFDRYDVCREMNAVDLFRMETRGEVQRVKVCSCLGDRCNGAYDGAGRGRFFRLDLLMLLLLGGFLAG